VRKPVEVVPGAYHNTGQMKLKSISLAIKRSHFDAINE
jgi:hypothetical protein